MYRAAHSQHRLFLSAAIAGHRHTTYLVVLHRTQTYEMIFARLTFDCRLLSEVDDKPANTWTGCDDKNFLDVIFADLVAVQALMPEARDAYR